MATSTFAAKFTDLVGGTIDDNACDDWMTEGAKEIINQLPAKLKAKCSTVTPLNDSSTTMDLDGVGDILHVTRLSANSGGYHVPCREIPAQYGGLATDSTDVNYYGTASDPVFWTASNTSDAGTLFVKPDPEATQIAYVHHVTYPTVDNGTDNTIANFPDEAAHLVVLYAAIRQLLQYQSTMSSSFNSDITTAFTATNTELDETQAICDLINTQADSAVVALGNMGTEIGLANAEVDLANPEVDLAKAEIAETVTLIDGGIDTAITAVKTAADLVNAEEDKAELEADKAEVEVDAEDMEKAQGYLGTMGGYISVAQGYLAEASGYVNEVNARIAQVNGQISVANGYLATASGYNQTGQAYLATAQNYGNQASGFLNAAQGFANELSQKIAIANGYIAEANARLGADSAKYSWYGDQYTKLIAEYARGLAALKGG